MMKTFYTASLHNKCKNLTEEQHSSTILIPKHLYDFWIERTRGGEVSRREYLHLLLKKYRFLVYNGILKKNEFLMTEIQETNLNLQKVAIRPYPEDWAELKHFQPSLNECFRLIFVG